MIKYENYIIFLRLLPDFNLSHQLRIINERFVNNRADHIPQDIRNELNGKRFLNLGSFYFYIFLVFPIVMVRVDEYIRFHTFRVTRSYFVLVHISLYRGK